MLKTTGSVPGPSDRSRFTSPKNTSRRRRLGVLIGLTALTGSLATVFGATPALAAAPNTVVATVAVGGGPAGVGVDPTTHTVYVADNSDNNVSVINGTTNTVTTTVAVGNAPSPVGVAATSHTVYVANPPSNTVSVIDEASNTVTATVPVGSHPIGIGIDPATHLIYVANFQSNNVSVIDGATNTVTATVAVGTGPVGVGVDATTHTVYVANNTGNNVSVIDGATNTVTATVAVGSGPFAVAVDPTTHTAYVGNNIGNSVSVINGTTNTTTATVAVGTGPSAVGVDPTTHNVFVANVGSNNVSVIDGATNTVGATVAVGSEPIGVGVDPSTDAVYVSNFGSNNVSVINGAKTPQTITFTPPSSGTPGGVITLSATGGASGNPVVFSVDGTSGAGVCTTSGTNGSTLTFNHGGSCVVDADQAGNVNFTAAPRVTRTITVILASPTIKTTPSGPTPAGGTASDSATLSGGYAPSGTITFTLYSPTDANCSSPLSTETEPVSGGAASSGPVTVGAAGSYNWVAAYSGDLNNNPVTSTCGSESQVVTAQRLTGRSYALNATVSLLGILGLKVGPVADTGNISTTSSSTTSTPCVASVPGLISANALCANVTTVAFPAKSTGTASVASAGIGLPLVPVISLGAVSSSSITTCAARTGSTTIAFLQVGSIPIITTPTVVAPNTHVTVGGVSIVLNEQIALNGPDKGLTVNAVHVTVSIPLIGGADIVIGSSSSDIGNCP